MRTWIVVNPAAGSGRALHTGQQLATLVDNATLKTTDGTGHAAALAREARAKSVETVAAVGGDGTIQEVVEGLCLDSRGSPFSVPGPRLAIVPAGTGGDYRRSFGLSLSIDQAATRIDHPQIVSVDVGLAQLEALDGSTRRLAFANVLSVGLGGLTDRLVETSPKWIGGRAAYFWGALRATLIYQPVPIELTIDGSRLPAVPYSNIAICIGRYFGGGMKIAPDAELNDGLFEVVTFESSRIQTLGLTPHIYRGTHLDHSCARHFQAQVLEVRATRPAEVLVDADGNQPGRLPLRVWNLKKAIQLAL